MADLVHVALYQRCLQPRVYYTVSRAGVSLEGIPCQSLSRDDEPVLYVATRPRFVYTGV